MLGALISTAAGSPSRVRLEACRSTMCVAFGISPRPFPSVVATLARRQVCRLTALALKLRSAAQPSPLSRGHNVTAYGRGELQRAPWRARTCLVISEVDAITLYQQLTGGRSWKKRGPFQKGCSRHWSIDQKGVICRSAPSGRHRQRSGNCVDPIIRWTSHWHATCGRW
jgi:hypothetical protein